MDGCLRIELRRGHRALRVTTYPLAEVRGAIVEFKMAEAGDHRVVLVLSTGEKVPLTDAFYGGQERHERAARQIQALLDARPT
jgi:hypothetical protein